MGPCACEGAPRTTQSKRHPSPHQPAAAASMLAHAVGVLWHEQCSAGPDTPNCLGLKSLPCLTALPYLPYPPSPPRVTPPTGLTAPVVSPSMERSSR